MENDELHSDSKSSVEITLNSKGEAQVKVKIYEDTTQEVAAGIKDVAINTWKSTLTELGLKWS